MAPLVPAENYFFWLGQAQFTRLILPNGASLSLRGTVQLTNDRLVPIEQIAVGGVYSVRGYPENLLVRDKGYYGTIELRYPLFDRPAQRNRLFVIPFFDFGAAWNVGQDPQDIQLDRRGPELAVPRFFGRAVLRLPAGGHRRRDRQQPAGQRDQLPAPLSVLSGPSRLRQRCGLAVYHERCEMRSNR